MNWFDNAGRAPTVDETRARQIDFALQRVRQTTMRAELEDATANAVAGRYAPPGSKTLRLQLERAAGDGPAAFHHHLVGLAFNALAHAVQSDNAPAVEAAALTVAAAAVRLVAHLRDGNNNGRAA